MLWVLAVCAGEGNSTTDLVLIISTLTTQRASICHSLPVAPDKLLGFLVGEVQNCKVLATSKFKRELRMRYFDLCPFCLFVCFIGGCMHRTIWNICGCTLQSPGSGYSRLTKDRSALCGWGGVGGGGDCNTLNPPELIQNYLSSFSAFLLWTGLM